MTKVNCGWTNCKNNKDGICTLEEITLEDSEEYLASAECKQFIEEF